MTIKSPDKMVPIAPLEAYLFNPVGQDWGKLLAPYSPPLPRRGEVRFASYFGDVFVEDEHGAVWWVNGMEARVDRIAINLARGAARIERDHLVTLKTKLIEQLIKADKVLPVGMLYGLKVPRSEGGKYHPDNIGTATISDTFAYLGQFFHQKQAKPEPPKPTLAEAKPNKSLWGKKK